MVELVASQLLHYFDPPLNEVQSKNCSCGTLLLTYLVRHRLRQSLQKLCPQEMVIGWHIKPKQMEHSSIPLSSLG